MCNAGMSSLVGEVYPNPLVASEDALNPQSGLRYYESGSCSERKAGYLARYNGASVGFPFMLGRVNNGETRGD